MMGQQGGNGAARAVRECVAAFEAANPTPTTVCRRAAIARPNLPQTSHVAGICQCRAILDCVSSGKGKVAARNAKTIYRSWCSATGNANNHPG